jgi:hypothetical protein
VIRVINELYRIYRIYGGDEYKAYLNRYQVYDILEDAGVPARSLYDNMITVTIRDGVAQISYRTTRDNYSYDSVSYFDFVERFSPILFLGLAEPVSYSVTIRLTI